MHYSVGALITQNGKYLMIDRTSPPLGFACIAGHIDDGEEEVQALKREIKEESGLTVRDLKLLFKEKIDWNWCKRGIKVHYWSLFNCKVSGKIKQNKEESKSINWYTKKQIQKLKLEPVWEYWFRKLNIIP